MESFDKKKLDAKLSAAFPMTHRWHNRFHLEMPFGLINDPNGLCRYEGEYHVFFQWNPLGCVHKNKCWAHVRTRDFVQYTLPELSLWPDDVHDKDGCYSGCAAEEDGRLRVLYTCNRRRTAASARRKSSCRIIPQRLQDTSATRFFSRGAGGDICFLVPSAPAMKRGRLLFMKRQNRAGRNWARSIRG